MKVKQKAAAESGRGQHRSEEDRTHGGGEEGGEDDGEDGENDGRREHDMKQRSYM